MKKRVWFGVFAVFTALLSLTAVAVPAAAQGFSGGAVLAVASGSSININGLLSQGEKAAGLTPAQVNGLVSQGEKAAGLTPSQFNGLVSQGEKAAGLTPAQVNGLVGQGEKVLQGQFPGWYAYGSSLGAQANAYGMGLINQLATALGLTPQQLLNELASGKTIAELAQENGVDLQAQIVQPLLSQGQALLQGQVQAGSLTQAQANAISSQAQAWIQWAVNTPMSQALSGMGLSELYNGTN
jgi:hypothetical protein